MMCIWRLSVMYIGPKSRTERPRKTKIGTEVAHVTRDSYTTFKVKRLKVKVTRPLWLGVQVRPTWTCSLWRIHVRAWCIPCHHLHGAGACCGGLPHSLLHCALSCTVCCNRPCLFVCLFVCGSTLLQPARSVWVASERFFIIIILLFVLLVFTVIFLLFFCFMVGLVPFW